ncbi:glycosyltransferase family 2 protein [Paenibacillus aceti]|uniref:Glycosyl transferase family 2 n=1 Tax=Paenibacillus aceti TaxID=1820010 RepID=A0ABQ1W152_9BACL|nr:glycosyltransferase family 2 protein [Paenibacillus aceti]GGG08246.1 glycosyl transferase family 2 [Paenibacillus aceti]
MKIKSIINRGLTALAGALQLRSRMKLSPISDLENADGTWISTGIDPAFLLEGRFFCGWNILTFNSISDEIIPVKLYLDEGTGFSEEKSLMLDSIKIGTNHYKTIFHVPLGTKRLRLDPGEQESRFNIEKIKIRKTIKYYIFIASVIKLCNQQGYRYTFKTMTNKFLTTYKSEGLVGMKQKIRAFQNRNQNNSDNYGKWISYNENNNIDEMIKEIKFLEYRPLISIILPVYNVDEVWLRKCIDSVINQIYGNWELCISDDASTKPHVKMVLTEYEKKDERIKVVYREKNGHISESSNSALEIATGGFIALLDHDDELATNALYEVVKLLNTYTDADMIYSDEDKIGINGERHSPYFKPDWSPDLILSNMYTCHLGVYRKSLVDKIGGFRKGFEGSQDFDLVLRLTELTTKIYHIPKILYHWRTIPESTASGSGAKNYTHFAGIKALEDTLRRRNIEGEVQEIEGYSNIYRLHYYLKEEPMVSIIIPTRDMGLILDKCIESIINKTTYSNYEIIIADNGSEEKQTFDIFQKWKGVLGKKLHILTLDIPFNYSKINNLAVQESKGSLILLLNNDIEVISPNWLHEMVGYSLRSNTGAVGAKLYYPDRTIQHSGVIMGLGGVAGHAFRTCNEFDPGYFGMLLSNRNYSVVTAACMMVRKEVFYEVGGLEEELSVAFNDVDFCLKLMNQGYYNVCLNSISLYHHESKTRGAEDTPEKRERFTKEINYMLSKWPGIIERDPFYNINLSLESDRAFYLKVSF